MRADLRAAAILEEVGTQPLVGVEVGVMTGDLSRRLLAGEPRLFLIMVDPWQAYEDGTYGRRITQAEMDAAMELAERRTRKYADRRRILRTTSVQAAQRCSDEWLEFAFIDGDHSYEAVRADLLAWWPKVKRRGLLCGHDWREEPEYEGVKRAVTEFASLRQKEIRLGANFTWFITR